MPDATIEFLPGEARYATDTAPLIYDSVHELMDFMYASRSDAERVLRRLLQWPSGHFGYRFSTVMVESGRVVGVELGYDRDQLSSQDLPGAINMLRAAPMSRWWHLIGTVSGVVSKYVPPPAADAYYINNIAVSPDQRGRGFGERLLKHVIDKARQTGYRCVELDVTQVNEGAIRFYQRHGFHVVSESGSGDLLARHGLPRLSRMRCLLSDRRRLSVDNEGRPDSAKVVNDVTGLNPVEVDDVYVPGSTKRLQAILRLSNKPISIGGGRFSMGGQTAEPGTLHVDMRGMNKVLAFDPEAAVIRVQAGTRWKEIQEVAGDHGLAVKIMQTYSNFTVGGSLSVNCHGRYVGLGPLILSVRSIAVLMHDGSLVKATPEENADVFYGTIGCYGALGIIVEAKLDLAPNTRIERVHKKMPLTEYPSFFEQRVRNNPGAVFHNADLVPPHFEKTRAVTWQVTDKPLTTPERPKHWRFYLLEKYMLWAITETPGGHLRREYLYEPLLYLKQKVSLRNQEADYDVAELEPLSRERRTYVLQEYFVPVSELITFVRRMSAILRRFGATTVNVSIRHAHADPGSLLAWAREEVFAFVLYYKQGTARHDREAVAVWTRELIDAVLESGGAYYLPYQPHGRYEQFHHAYPRARELFALKDRHDPDYRFRNVLWEQYYRRDDDAPLFGDRPVAGSEFLTVYGDIRMRDDFYRFLQTIYHLYPEDRFHALIIEACERYDSDEEIYAAVAAGLPGIKTFLSELTYALPALRTQKLEMRRQTIEILQGRRNIDGYLEIGSTGRYVKTLTEALAIQGPVYLTNDVRPDNSPPEIMERGGLKRVGRFFDLDDYAPIPGHLVADHSLDLVTCYIGLHHCPREKLAAFIASIRRVLRPGGHFVLRDHDAGTDEMRIFASLVHTVFNAGLDVSWEEDRQELRLFEGLGFWVEAVEQQGFSDTGQRLLQAHDPSLNTLLCFTAQD